jgi:nucleoside-diphosphate-sugar epimerase
MGIEKIACVTGASGRIGRRLVNELKKQKFQIRVLRHRSNINDKDLSVFHGDICNQELLEDFLADAQYVFHFAAELNDQDRMWDINVNGTQKIVKAAKEKNVKYFCFLSSAGVVGKTSQKEINEYIKCSPQNLYEKSKLEAEHIILSGIENCQVIALRPTNVVDENNHGVMESLNSNSWVAKIKLFIRGGECAHVVHADDVVNAATYFMDKQFDKPECFFVSYDEDYLNTFAGLRLIYDALERKQSLNSIRKHWHLPITIPFVLRKILRGNGNMGDVNYSSKKILSYGFSYKVGLRETIKKYWENQQEYK